jgi:hypothetical protein
MKNHLSMEASIFSGCIFSSWGMCGSWSGETRLGDWETVRLVLCLCQGRSSLKQAAPHRTYVAMPPAGVFPVMSFSQASAHSRITSIAYLE